MLTFCILLNYSTAWSHVHIVCGFHEVDAQAVQKVFVCVHLPFPGFCRMKRLGVVPVPTEWDASSLQGYPRIKFIGCQQLSV